MDRHTANHAKGKPFRCPNCRFAHRDSSVFVDHLIQHLPKTRTIQCCFCSYKATLSMMKSHMLQHSPAVRLDCSECEYWTSSINSMKDHIEVYHTKKHPCRVCSKLLTKYALTKHIRSVHKTRKPRSVSIGRKYGNHLKKVNDSRLGLTIDPAKVTKKTPQIVRKSASASAIPVRIPVVQLERCRVPTACWKALDSSQKPLATRSGIHKSLDKLPECSDPTGPDMDDSEETTIASFEVPKGKLINKPIYFHSLVLEFSDTLLTCSICDYQTRKEHLLKRHTAQHDNDKPFNCQKCDFQHVSVYEFANHMLKHKGAVEGDVYSCCFCDFWTHMKHNIPIHLDKHRGARGGRWNKDFDCPECEEVISGKTELLSHFDKFHRQDLSSKSMTKFELDVHLKEHVNGSNDSDDPGPSHAINESISVLPSNPSRNTKPKPHSRRKQELKSGSKRAKKTDEKTAKSSAAASKYTAKPISKQEPLKSISNILTDTSVKGPRGSGATGSPPEPLSRKTIPESDIAMKSATGIEVVSDAVKRKRTPTPTKCGVELPEQYSVAKDLECRYCEYKTQIALLMDRHREKHKGASPFKCTKCKYETLSSSKIAWHYLHHIPSDEDFPCPYCPFRGKTRQKLPVHIERHRTKFFDCSKCQFSGNNPNGVKRHFERMHVDKYNCAVCDKVMTKHAMMKHLKKRHPSVCSGPLESSYTKHCMNYMKPLSGTAEQQKLKRPKTSASEVQEANSASILQKPASSIDSGIKAAQQALVSDIFGAMLDSDDDKAKACKYSLVALSGSSKVPHSSNSVAKLAVTVKSDDSDSDSDSGAAIQNLSCPKCDFITDQITIVKNHYREMHEFEYICKLCHVGSLKFTKHEILIHFKKNHPDLDSEYYRNNMQCCTPIKVVPTAIPRPIKVESNDSEDSNDAQAPFSGIPLPKEVKLESESTTDSVPGPEQSAPVLMGIEESYVDVQNSDQQSDSTVAESSALPEMDSIIDGDHTKKLHVAVENLVKPAASSEQPKSSLEESPQEPPVVFCIDALRQQETDHSVMKNDDEVCSRRFNCKDCSFGTSRMSLLHRHSVRHKVGAPLVCPQCRFQNNSPYKFLLHWTNHFPDQKAFKCCFCAFVTASTLDLSLHFCLHNNTRVYDCDECEYSTTMKAFIEGHIWNIHKKVTCRKCQESMPKSDLVNHKCMPALDDDLLNWDCGHEMGAGSGVDDLAREEQMASSPVVKSETSRDLNGVQERYSEGNTCKLIIARESFTTSRLSEFSFQSKWDKSDDVVSTKFPPVEDVGVAEEPSPLFEPLSAEAESGDDEAPIDDSTNKLECSREVECVPAVIKDAAKTVKTCFRNTAEMFSSTRMPSVSHGVTRSPPGRKIQSSAKQDDAFDLGDDVSKSIAVEDPTSELDGQSTVSESSMKTALQMEHSADEIFPSGESAQSIFRQNIFTGEGSYGSLPIIDISGKAASPVKATEPTKAPSLCWIDPLKSDDDFRGHRMGKSITQGASSVKIIAAEEPLTDRISPRGDSSQSIFWQNTFTGEESFGSLSILDVSGKTESPVKASKPRKAPSSCWMDILESDDDLRGQRRMGKLVTQKIVEPSTNEISPSGESSESIFRQNTGQDSYSALPIIDIYGKAESPVKAAKPTKAPSTSWTEPVESDDDYFVTSRWSKSPTASLSPSSSPHRSRDKSDDLLDDQVSEVVFDNGMSALVFEISDSEDEEVL